MSALVKLLFVFLARNVANVLEIRSVSYRATFACEKGVEGKAQRMSHSISGPLFSVTRD
jgi:hypothetical protein